MVKRRPTVFGGIFGSNQPRRLTQVFAGNPSAYSEIAADLLFSTPKKLSFFPGEVRVEETLFRMDLRRSQIQPGSDIAVSGAFFNLRVKRTLSFQPSEIPVAGSTFDLRTTRRSLLISPGVVEVTGTVFRLSPTLRRSAFLPGIINVTGSAIRLEPYVTLGLPDLIPTSRRFTPPRYPVKEFRTENGLLVRRHMGHKPSGATLELSYENINDSSTVSALALYDASYGGMKPVELPPGALVGADPELQAFLSTPHPGTFWTFSGPPRVRFKKIGVCDLEISLVTRFVIEERRISDIRTTCKQSVWDDADPNLSVTCDVLVPPDCATVDPTGCT